MRVIAISTLKSFWEKKDFRDSEQPLRAWYDEAKKAKWKRPADIKRQYRNASFLANNRVVFNIHGNKYRLVVAFNYEHGIAFIKFIGTHKEYDKIDAESV